MRDVMRLKHLHPADRTILLRLGGVVIRFHRMRHPHNLREKKVSEFLTHLAREGKVAASTQNQALSALLFLCKQGLKEEIGWFGNVERAKKPARLLVVLTRDEAHKFRAGGRPPRHT